MKCRTKVILISVVVLLCSLWWGAAHVLYRYTAFASPANNYYASLSHEERVEQISHAYERVIIPLLQVLCEVNSPETAQHALGKTTDLCKLLGKEVYSVPASDGSVGVVGFEEWDKMVDAIMRSETAAQERHQQTTEKLLREVKRLEACDYYGCTELQHLIQRYIYGNGVLQYLPSAPLRMAALTTTDASWGATLESRLKRERHYLLDVLLLGTFRLLSTEEILTHPAHNEYVDVYQLDPEIELNGPECAPYSYISPNYTLSQNICSLGQPPMFSHCCSACHYAEFNQNIVIKGHHVLNKEQRLESIRIVELAQYSMEELMSHPQFMDSYKDINNHELLYFELAAPCQSIYLEIAYKDGKLYAMKYWKKSPRELREKRKREERQW